MEVVPGRPSINCNTMLSAIAQALSDNIDIIVFPEMAIPGYLLGDEWERRSVIDECQQCGERIKQAAAGITIVFGNVGLENDKLNEDGRPRKFNACFVAEDQEFIPHPRTALPFHIKFLMPNYREFDDNRYFYDPRKLAYERSLRWEDLVEPVPSKHGLLGCILCEDGWDDDYNISPIEILCQKGATQIINISCSPYTYNKNHKRYRVFSQHAAKHNVALLYVNCVGLQDNGKTVFTIDGSSCFYDADGKLTVEAEPYRQQAIDKTSRASATNKLPSKDGPENLYNAIDYGTRKFLQRTGIKKIVIGVSGGIDSALVAAIYRQILNKDQLLLVNMPGPYTSSTTIKLARELAQNLDCYYAEFKIGDVAQQTREQIQSTEFSSADLNLSLPVNDFVFENIQARDRSSRVLAGIAAAFGGAFTCNANKSEMTVGYSTLYGDLGGCLASIADLWKTEVYQLASWINQNIYGREAIPQGTIDIVPSAELSAQQDVDQGKGDPLFYPYHDKLFQSWVERWQRATPEDNLQWYIDGTLARELDFDGDLDGLFSTPKEFVQDLERWWNLYQGIAIAKRIQAPPVLAVKRRAFGFDHREAQLGPRYSEKYLRMKRELGL